MLLFFCLYIIILVFHTVSIICQIKIEQACHFAIVFFQKWQETVLFVKGNGRTVGIYCDEAASCLIVEYKKSFYEVYKESTQRFSLKNMTHPKAAKFTCRIAFYTFFVWESFTTEAIKVCLICKIRQ